MSSTLTLGPLLRYVDETTASIWLQTSRAGTVEVRAGDSVAQAPTFTAHGYHYALVTLKDLTPASSVAYTIHFGTEQLWPEPQMPPSLIHTQGTPTSNQFIFGSCRAPMPYDEAHQKTHGTDVLKAYAHQLMGSEVKPPTALILLGDQVYADHLPPAMREYIAARRDLNVEPGAELSNFHEYAEMYRLSWDDPAIRWLLASVPSVMIFDDHDVRDDWNTSAAWRAEIEAKPWWGPRITSALGSYWIYQHIGNLSPTERAHDPLWRLAERGGDLTQALDEFAQVANADPSSYRWSYRRDFGHTRLLMLDTRCGRDLTPGARDMLPQWQWMHDQSEGDYQHLLIGSSLPVLLPPALHHAEQWNEKIADGSWGKRWAAFAERLRQTLDLEHWAAFIRSFGHLTDLAERVARKAPVTFLSGDVHYSYLARGDIAGINQVVCSPIRNPLSPFFRYANVIASWRITAWCTRLLAKAARCEPPRWRWKMTTKPFFNNVLARLDIKDQAQHVAWFTAEKDTSRTVELHQSKLAP
ncbi:MAG: alkaline phosphatase family protein [Corynebacteriales bacterium]|nr:alkaline phosphatase family protein [Mycobacteriales bacterium]